MLPVQEELRLNKIAYSVICEPLAEKSYKHTDGLTIEQHRRIQQIITDYVEDKARKIALLSYKESKELLQKISPWLRDRVEREVNNIKRSRN